MRLRRVALVATAAAGALLPAAALQAVPAAAANPLANTSVYALASFAGKIWAGTDNGLYTLASGSSTWTAAGGAFEGREVAALAVAGSWLVAGTAGGAVRTGDGTTWSGAGLSGERVASLAFAGGVLLAGTGHESGGDGLVHRSDDSGATWTSALAPALLGLSGDMVQAVLAPSGSSPAWAGTGGGGSFRSSDGKGGWSAASGMKTNWVTSFWRDPANSGRVLAGSDDGLYSWSGSAWTAASFPQQDPWVQALAGGSDGRPLAGTFDGDVFAQGSSGSWTSRASGLPSVLSLLSVGSGGVLVGTTGGVVCVSCPANVAAAAASPGARGSKAAATLPPPGSRTGATAHPGATSSAAAGRNGVGRTTGAPEVGLPGVAGAGSGSGSGGVPVRWLIAGALVALAALLLVVGQLRARRTAAEDD